MMVINFNLNILRCLLKLYRMTSYIVENNLSNFEKVNKLTKFWQDFIKLLVCFN